MSLRKIITASLAATVVFAGALGGVARAQRAEYEGGDQSTRSRQTSSSNSGDAVAGQVVGVVSAGDASVDATNRSEDVVVETGDADVVNTSDNTNLRGPLANNITVTAGPGVGSRASFESGDQDARSSQDASAASGDGVGGQVIGVVTSAGGSADVVAANTSIDSEIVTGDATAVNLSELNNFVVVTDVAVTASGVASSASFDSGDQDARVGQVTAAATGDGVGGQVLGIVSAGDASVDATNLSQDVLVETGDADAISVATVLNLSAATSAVTAVGGSATAALGDQDARISQNNSANSGDAVAGQVGGVVTAAGGSADLVLANTSLDVDAISGEGTNVLNELSTNISLTARIFVTV